MEAEIRPEGEGVPADSGSLTFEQTLARLEEVVALLERGQPSLEEALRLFQEGIGLVRACTRVLDEAEGVVERLLESPDGAPRVEPLRLEGEGA